MDAIETWEQYQAAAREQRERAARVGRLGARLADLRAIPAHCDTFVAVWTRMDTTPGVLHRLIVPVESEAHAAEVSGLVKERIGVMQDDDVQTWGRMHLSLMWQRPSVRACQEWRLVFWHEI